MAEKNVNYKVNVDTGKAQDDLEDLKDGFQETGDEAKKSGKKIEDSSEIVPLSDKTALELTCKAL